MNIVPEPLRTPMPPTASRTGRPASRVAIAVLAAVALFPAMGPARSASAGWSGAGRALGHSCCCGTSCGSGCCCSPGDRATPTRSGDPERPEGGDLLKSLAIDPSPSPCIGPMPCGGGDAGTPPSLSSHRDRPAAIFEASWPAAEPGRAPLPLGPERFRPALPGDVPSEPPERASAGLRS
ncbi:hypothetical protein [Tautonia sociabilis]|uniref:Uncharacterized protein n=1 Tax=Tautonia sociabilis TaxID=2080755 RepID=A0A432MHM6_9BACT|nr:hypothetical protein [Tautonia sociabilis]RUL86312.1 hypothetical protein TsocGM_16420 [Tautonia sociabilis]